MNSPLNPDGWTIEGDFCFVLSSNFYVCTTGTNKTDWVQQDYSR